MRKKKSSTKFVLKLLRSLLLLRIWMLMNPSFIELPPVLHVLQILVVVEVVEFSKIKNNHEIQVIRAKKLRLPHHQGTKLNSLIVIS